jgi:hypothetical protein
LLFQASLVQFFIVKRLFVTQAHKNTANCAVTDVLLKQIYSPSHRHENAISKFQLENNIATTTKI